MQTSFTLAQLADPNVAESEKILRTCVHCGFCTATCPTYVLLGDELDSPRGRIYLIKEMLEHDAPATRDVVTHIDRCLSCLSCMTTCPSGVHYMHLVDHARVHIEKTYRRPLFNRALRAVLAAVLPDNRRFRAALTAGPPGEAAGAVAGGPRPQAARRDAAARPRTPAGAGRHRRAGLPRRRPPQGPGGTDDGVRHAGDRAVDQRRRHPRADGGTASRWCCRRGRGAAAGSSTTWAASTMRSPPSAATSTPGSPRPTAGGSTPSSSPPPGVEPR